MPIPQAQTSAVLQYRRRSHVSSAQQGGTTVLLDLAQDRYYTLNEVGGRIWDLLQEGASLTELVHQLNLEYDAPQDQLLADAGALLAELEQAKLIESSRL